MEYARTYYASVSVCFEPSKNASFSKLRVTLASPVQHCRLFCRRQKPAYSWPTYQPCRESCPTIILRNLPKLQSSCIRSDPRFAFYREICRDTTSYHWIAQWLYSQFLATTYTIVTLYSNFTHPPNSRSIPTLRSFYSRRQWETNGGNSFPGTVTRRGKLHERDDRISESGIQQK